MKLRSKGVTSDNASSRKSNQGENPGVKRLLGVEGSLGENMGLDNDWAFNIISQVGNYGEAYARNVGPDSPLGIGRGINALWTDGGLMYSMPFR